MMMKKGSIAVSHCWNFPVLRKIINNYLDVHFLDVLQDEIHVFVETNDDSLETKVDDIVEPDLKMVQIT